MFQCFVNIYCGTDLPDVCGGEDAVLTDMVGQLTAKRHYDGHDQVRQRGQRAALSTTKQEQNRFELAHYLN